MKQSQVSRVRVLLRFTRPHLRTLAIGLILGLIASAMGLATPLVTQRILDSFNDGPVDLTWPIGILATLLVIGTLVSWWQWVILGTLAEDVVYEARASMIRRFLQARVLPLLRRPNGEMVTRVTSDSVLLRESVSSSLVGIINGVVMVVGTLILMTVLDVVLMLTTVIAIAVIALVFVGLLPAVAKNQELAQHELSNLGGALAGTLRGIKTVKVGTAEERQENMLLEHAQRSRMYSVRAVRRESLLWSVAQAGLQAATLVVLVVGAWRVSQDEITVSILVAFLLYVIGLLGPVMDLSENVTALQNGIAAAGRIQQIDELEQEELVRQDSKRSAVATEAPAVEFDGVIARYSPDSPPALNQVSFEVPSKGHVAIVGPSGAGKTTIFSLMLGFIEPERGQMLVNGAPSTELGVSALRRSFAYVEQESPMLPGTLRDNLVFLSPETSDHQIHQILEQLHLTDLVRSLPKGLDTDISDTNVSGGQRQRIALARALLANTSILLLDEATAQVDGITESTIHDVIRERSKTMSVVTIAHRLSTVIDADSIIVVDDAQISDQGSHQELLQRNELYIELVKSLGLDTSKQSVR